MTIARLRRTPKLVKKEGDEMASVRWRGLTSGLLALFLIASTTVLPGSLRPQAVAGERSASLIKPADFANPPASARPKGRWSWPGADVVDEELRAEIGYMSAAGFGGAEVSWLPLNVFPPNERTAGFGTPEFAQHVAAALRAARAKGFSLDLTLGPVWPVATPVTNPDNGLSVIELAYGAKDVEGPATFSEPAPEPDRCRPNLFGHPCGDQEKAQFVAATAARPSDQTQDSSSEKPIMLDAASAIDLTPMTDADGNVTWEVPQGRWIVFGFWGRPTGQQPLMKTAQPEAAYVIDYFSRAAAKAATKYLDEKMLPPKVRSNLKGAAKDVFEDSVELSTPWLLWTWDFLSEFRKRRGYSLTRYLPTLFIPDQHNFGFEGSPDYEFTDTYGSRARHDYYRTLTDLYIDNHLAVLRAWARQRGLRFRAQPAYGMPGLEPTRSAQALDFVDTETLHGGDSGEYSGSSPSRLAAPETPEGRRVLDFYRVIAAGAHVAGIRRVSTELAATVNWDYMLFHSALKRMIDRSYAGGVTQMILCCPAYREAPGSTWPGWAPFSPQYVDPRNWFEAFLHLYHHSDGWNPAFPEWRHFPAINAYMGRANQVLESGQPQLDVVIYRHETTLLNLGVPEEAGPYFDATTLERRGYTHEYLDPVTMASAPFKRRPARLFPKGPSYRAVVISSQKHWTRPAFSRYPRAMDPDAATRLRKRAERGMPVVFVGKTPKRSTSNTNRKVNDKRVRREVAAMLRLPNVRRVAVESSPNGKRSDVASALRGLGVEPAAALKQPLRGKKYVPIRLVHRSTAKGDVWFLLNENSKPVNFTGSFRAAGTPHRYDLWNGKITPLAHYRRVGQRVKVPLTLGPGETMVLGFHRADRKRVHVVSTDAQEVVFAGSELRIRDTRTGSRSVMLSNGRRMKVSMPRLPERLDVDAWHLHVKGAVPSGTDVHDLDLPELADWRELDHVDPESGRMLRDSSGIGTYTAKVTLDKAWKDRGAYLDLGDVAGSVRVVVNGKLATKQTIPTGRIDLRRVLHPGDNILKVKLATTLNNRMVAEKDSGECCRNLATRTVTQPYGLLGPVRLIPYVERVIKS